MKLTRLIPNIFYSDIQPGINFFVNGLGFEILYKDTEAENKFHIIGRDGIRIHLLEDDEFAKKDRPEIRIETDDIEAFYQEIKARDPGLFHPNLGAIKLQPWGLKEFALLDRSQVCVIVQQRTANES